MGAGKILSLISNMSLVITDTKASLLEGAQRIWLFCVVWQLHAAGTKSPMSVGTENLRKGKLLPPEI